MTSWYIEGAPGRFKPWRIARSNPAPGISKQMIGPFFTRWGTQRAINRYADRLR